MTSPRTRSLLIVAVCVAAAGAAVLAAVELDRESPRLVSSSPGGAASAASTRGQPLGSPPDAVVWTPATELGSMARSSVVGVVAGPTGFVATGRGYDDERNQGRVWYSADGRRWIEPALEMFDTRIVGRPVATSDGFYVVAAGNPDRTPESEGEGVIALADAQLYRSADGRDWHPHGDVLGELPQITTVGDTLLRLHHPDDLRWSADGVEWQPADVPDGLAIETLARSTVLTDARTWLPAWRDGQPSGVVSGDGRTWEEMPTRPGGVDDTDDRIVAVSDHAMVAIETGHGLGETTRVVVANP